MSEDIFATDSVSSMYSKSVFLMTEFTDKEDATDKEDENYDPKNSNFTADRYGVIQSTYQYILLQQAQDRIGWDHFFRGKLSFRWN